MALRLLQFCTGGAPLGTPFVTFLHHMRPWHSVCYGSAPVGPPLALRSLLFCTGRAPLGTSEEQSFQVPHNTSFRTIFSVNN